MIYNAARHGSTNPALSDRLLAGLRQRPGAI